MAWNVVRIQYSTDVVVGVHREIIGIQRATDRPKRQESATAAVWAVNQNRMGHASPVGDGLQGVSARL